MFKWLSRRSAHRRDASVIYRRIVAQSRLPAFYARFGVADTVEGRFEVLVLHMFLVLERLRRHDPNQASLAQHLVDAFFADMDTTMRELGVGDLAVPKRMRKLAGAFYERLGSYRQAMTEQPGLAKAIEAHIFGGANPESAQALASYSQRTLDQTGDRAEGAPLAGAIAFAPLEEASAP